MHDNSGMIHQHFLDILSHCVANAEPASEQEQLIRIMEANQLLSRDEADALIEHYRRLREDRD